MGCWGLGSATKASRVYQKRMLSTMLLYLVMMLGAAWIVRHEHPQGWHLYFWALAPAVPILIVLVYLGIYLRDETDEFVRMMAMRSLLVATALLLATVTLNDFLRSFTPVGALPPFTGFALFFASFGIAQVVQNLMSLGGSDE